MDHGPPSPEARAFACASTGTRSCTCAKSGTRPGTSANPDACSRAHACSRAYAGPNAYAHRHIQRGHGERRQTYGAFMVDHAGAPTLYAENLTGKAVLWAGLLAATDARPFLASDFEVLSLPVLTSAKAR